jgi:AcrR family transcriptional regulator
MNQRSEQIKTIILTQTFELILKRGARAFTIDGLATELGMSKKTIYKYFLNKENLIENCFVNFSNSINDRLETIAQSESHPVKSFLQSVDIIHHEISKFSPDLLKEIKIHYPVIWMKLDDFKKKRLRELMLIFEKGQEQGYIDNDIDLNITTSLLLGIVNIVFQPEFFSEEEIRPGDMYKSFLDLITKGILTEKGRKYVEEF